MQQTKTGNPPQNSKTMKRVKMDHIIKMKKQQRESRFSENLLKIILKSFFRRNNQKALLAQMGRLRLRSLSETQKV